MLRLFVRPVSSVLRDMYAGIESDIFPRGPSMEMFEPACVLLTREVSFGAGGCMMCKVTSGGRVIGARPILERRCEVVEK